MSMLHAVAGLMPKTPPAPALPSKEFQATTIQGASTIYTFSTQALGSASATRRVIVGIGLIATAARTISSVTIGGVSATEVDTAADSNNFAYRTSMYIADVPTGATGDVVVTASGACLGCSLSVWAAYDLTSGTKVDSDKAQSFTSPINVPSVSTSADGIAVGMATYLRETGTAAFGWTNLTERSDTQATVSGSSYGASAADAGTSGSGIAASITMGGTPDYGFAIVASFR